MQSDQGDWVGKGDTWYFDESNADFTINSNYGSYYRGIDIRVTSKNNGPYFSLNFDANWTLLKTGLYENAVRFPFNDSGPGLSITGNGAGCNTVKGSFDVKSITYNANNEVDSVYIEFTQHCEGLTPALRGSIVYNASKYPLCSSLKPTPQTRARLNKLNLVTNRIKSLESRLERMKKDLEDFKTDKRNLSESLKCR